MKKKRYILLTLILSLLGMPKIYALSCTETKKDEFKRIRNEYKITTEFDSTSKTYNMKIEKAESSSYDWVFTIGYQYDCEEKSKTLTECTGLKPGTIFTARVVGVTDDCNDILKEELINLAYYNEYHENELCKGNEEFALCQETYDKEIDKETFESRIETYIQTKKEKQEEEKKQEKINNNIINKTTSYLKENLVQVIIVVVFVILIIISIIVTIISTRKSRRLE